MSYRKTRLIQERNLLLERKYILEQAPPGPLPPAPPPAEGTPPPAPVTPQQSTPSTSTQTKKITKEQINKAPKCSGFDGITNNPKYERKEEKINGVNYVYYLTEKKDMVFCRDESV